MSFFELPKSTSPTVTQAKADAKRLLAHVIRLTHTTFPRTFNQPAGLEEAAAYIESEWQTTGLDVERQWFEASGSPYFNLLTSIGPDHGPRIVIGAHYDVAGEANPGADDNASGLAGLIELARLLKPVEHKLKRRIDLVAFCLEEPPFFGSAEMGSAVHAKSLRTKGTQVELMISLEMIGFFSDLKNSQDFPLPQLKFIYPSKGNFIGVVGDTESGSLTSRVRDLMANGSSIDVQMINAPRTVAGIDLSDHRNYWNVGYPAVMITDTAFFRNPHYHGPGDTFDTLDYKKMAEVVNGVARVALEF